MTKHMGLPVHFCWTRFGTEAGQTAAHILRRKEQERLANGGIFLWGIGNSVAPSIRELVRNYEFPEVLFSPIRSSPKQIDVEPECVVAWTWGETDEGKTFSLPQYCLVTSRQNTVSPKTSHYALVCFSGTPLNSCETPHTLEFDALRNFLSGNPLGASQVTAVVQRDDAVPIRGGKYPVVLRAHLVPPFFIRLRGPIPVQKPGALLNDWQTAVRSIWEQRVWHPSNPKLFDNQCELPFSCNHTVRV